MLTWTSLAWVARAPDGRQTADLVSLSQMSQAFRHGALPPDVEAAMVGEWAWENIRLVLARYSSLAPPGTADTRGTDGEPELELTLTVQRDAVGRVTSLSGVRPDSGRTFAAARPHGLPVTMPPPPRPGQELPRRWPATPSLRDVLDWSLEPPLPARLASLLYVLALLVAGVLAVAAIIAGIYSLFERLNDATEGRMVVLALLVGLGWVLGGGLVAAVVVVLGRAAAGLVLVANRLDEKARDETKRDE